MSELVKNINDVIKEIEEVTELLYQQRISQGYAMLNVTLENLMNVVDEIFNFKVEGKLQFNEENLVASLTNAMKAMEEKDYVLLSDILLYEIVEQLKECKTSTD